MNPLYFNPSTPTTSNYIGDNPLESFTTTPEYMQPAYFNPSLYQSFTFDQFPKLSYVIAPMVTTNSTGFFQTLETSYNSYATEGVTSTDATFTSYTLYNSTLFYSSLGTYAIDYTTYYSHVASSMILQSMTFSQRFGTELQTIYASEASATDVYSTYQSTSTHAIYSSTDVIYSTFVTLTEISGVWETLYSSEGLFNIYESTGLLNLGSTTLLGQVNSVLPDGVNAVGSSMFVEMLGSNVYTGLLITTNSVIIYNNEQISSYYSESLSYQVNIANLTAALNSVSTTGCEEGQCDITVTTFSWTWYTTTGGWSGSQVTDFPDYLTTESVNSYLSVNYGGTTITNSSVAVTQIQSIITVENNSLSNSQTFLNNSVTTLQSQVSLAGQIITSLSSATQAVIGNI